MEQRGPLLGNKRPIRLYTVSYPPLPLQRRKRFQQSAKPINANGQRFSSMPDDNDWADWAFSPFYALRNCQCDIIRHEARRLAIREIAVRAIQITEGCRLHHDMSESKFMLRRVDVCVFHSAELDESS